MSRTTANGPYGPQAPYGTKGRRTAAYDLSAPAAPPLAVVSLVGSLGVVLLATALPAT
ncbi:hypothetical protein [Streptomyces sp. NPDC088766]|uniref:hypothetical protein n=1 Tax=Streptomyces sp. NPDC088766 TaxID=3365893 RepID=UPI00381A1505